MRIVNDTGWSGENAGRCITKYTREITLEPNNNYLINTEDKTRGVGYLESYVFGFLNPGWSSFSTKEIKTNVFQFISYNDSSD